MMVNTAQIFEYIQNKFNTDLEELYEVYTDDAETMPLLAHTFDIKWMDKISVTRELEKTEPYSDEIGETIPIIAIINEDSVDQDPAVPHDIYQLNASMSFMIEETYIDEFYEIMKNYIVKNKVIKHKFGNNTAMINIDSGWDDSRDRVRGKKMYMADMSISILVLASVLFSNDITMDINGSSIENSSISIINETEMVPNLKKRVIMEFIPQTSVVQVAIVAFYDINNGEMNTLVQHISSSSLFNQPMSVVLKINIEPYIDVETGDTITTKDLLTMTMYAKSVEIEAQRGTVAILKASFVTATSNVIV